MKHDGKCIGCGVENGPLVVSENARLREAIKLAMEWAAKYPLMGDGSFPDVKASAEVYEAARAALRGGTNGD